MTAVLDVTELSAQELGALRLAEMERLIKSGRGTLTPERMLRFAEKPDTALHSVFTWDDTECGQKWRLHEAHAYIRARVTVIQRGEAEAVSVRAFVSLPSDRVRGAYRPIVQVLNDDDLRAEMIAEARREFGVFRSKFGHLEKLADAMQVMDEALSSA